MVGKSAIARSVASQSMPDTKGETCLTLEIHIARLLAKLYSLNSLCSRYDMNLST